MARAKLTCRIALNYLRGTSHATFIHKYIEFRLTFCLAFNIFIFFNLFFFSVFFFGIFLFFLILLNNIQHPLMLLLWFMVRFVCGRRFVD